MNLRFLPRFSSPKTLFQHPLALLGGVLLCVVPMAAKGQSVTFAGAQMTLPTSGLNYPYGIAVDSSGNVFIADFFNNRVVELPRTATGYGPQTTLPADGLNEPTGVAVDSAGDVLISDGENNRVVELPRTATGYGPQTTLPASGLSFPEGIAVDGAGNIFIADNENNRVVELPRTTTGYGPQATLASDDVLGPSGVAVDGAGDVFIGANDSTGPVVELLRTATGFGTQTPLLFAPSIEEGVAVDSAGDLFVDWFSDLPSGSFVLQVVELPRTATGYGPLTTLLTGGSNDFALNNGVAVDGEGDVFIPVRVGNGVDYIAVELQTRSVNFEGVNVCAPGQTTPAPCSQTLTLNFNIIADVTLGTTPNVLTGGAPNLDFTLANGSTCSNAVTVGTTCTVNVTFKPKFAGTRQGAVQIVDGGGNVLATTLIYGTGISPQIAYTPAPQTTLPASGLGETWGVAVDGIGDVFIADESNSRIVRLPAGGGAQTTVGSGLFEPQGVAVDGAGDVFIADTENNRVVEVPTAGGAQTTLPLSGLSLPSALTVDAVGDVFVSDSNNNRVLELPAGGGAQITLPFNGLSFPRNVAVDALGDLFVADFLNNRVVELPAASSAPITLPFVGLFSPSGLAVDGVGDVFVTNNGYSSVLELPVGGHTAIEVGTGFPYYPNALAVDSAGDLFVSLEYSKAVVELQRSNPPSLTFAPTPVGTSGSPQSVQIQNIGNATLSLSGLSISANFDLVPGPGMPADCTASSSLSPGESCDISVRFSPVAATPTAHSL